MVAERTLLMRSSTVSPFAWASSSEEGGRSGLGSASKLLPSDHLSLIHWQFAMGLNRF